MLYFSIIDVYYLFIGKCNTFYTSLKLILCHFRYHKFIKDKTISYSFNHKNMSELFRNKKIFCTRCEKWVNF